MLPCSTRWLSLLRFKGSALCVQRAAQLLSTLDREPAAPRSCGPSCGKCHDCYVLGPPHKHLFDPRIHHSTHSTLCHHDAAGAVDQQRSQVRIATFTDAEQLHPTASPRLSRHQTQEGPQTLVRRRKLRASATVATTAVAVSRPMSLIGVMEPGMIGLMAPQEVGWNRHPERLKNYPIYGCLQCRILRVAELPWGHGWICPR